VITIDNMITITIGESLGGITRFVSPIVILICPDDILTARNILIVESTLFCISEKRYQVFIYNDSV
jgi:hypothetical protein